MKAITILRMHPGAETQRKALELFLKHGSSDGNEWVLGSADTQTYIALGELDADIASNATYAPYFDVEVIPVVDLDESWVAAMQEAVKRQA
jgi:hypothetical protein